MAVKLVSYTDTKAEALRKKKFFMNRGMKIKIIKEYGGYSVLKTGKKR